jgi:hypothetical protein
LGEGRFEQRVGEVIAAWVDACGRRPGRVLVAGAALVALSLLYSVGHLRIQGATETLFAQDLPFKQVERRYYEAFPTLYEPIFVVLDAVTPERAGQAAAALAERLGRDREHFHRVYQPGGGEFFETHAFLYLSTEELEDLADRLAEAQPYLAELSRDGSLRGLLSMLGRGVRAAREGDVGAERLVPVFDRLSQALDAAAGGRPYHLSWAEVLAPSGIDVDARQRLLLVYPMLDAEGLQPARRAILAVRAAARELGLSPESGVRVRITGDVALSTEELEVVRSQAAWSGLASFLLVALILLVGMPSGRLITATLVTLLAGLVLTGGFTALAIGHFNMISVCFAVLFIGLGVDFGIHFCVRYRELRSRRMEHAEALRSTARDVGTSVLLCGLTTAVGFFAFVPTDFVGVAELGLISGAGMFISLACTMTLLPAVLSLPPHPKPGAPPAPAPRRAALAELPVRWPRLVRATAVALFAGAVVLLPRARFDNNPLHVRDPASESVQTLAELLERGGSSPWSLNAVAPDLASAEALASRLRRLEVVERVVTPADFVPEDQAEKLEIIGDVAILLAPLPGSDGTAAPLPAEQAESLRVLSVELRRLLAEGADPTLLGSAGRLRASIDRFLAFLGTQPDRAPALRALEASVLGSLPEQLRLLEAGLRAGEVTLENLPDVLLETMIAADGRVRVQIFPRDDLDDNAALAAFVDAVREVEPEVAGSASEILESGREVVRALRQALLLATVAIALLLWVLWRDPNDTALVMIPLGLAATFTVAASVLLDIPFNFADVIVLPLLLGIGVDTGIHLVHRARIGLDGAENLLATSTTRAAILSALTTIASFGTMGFATHLGLATLGQLLTIGVALTLACNLVVLPALLALRTARRRVPGAVPTPPAREI